jgi:hypothetical protein
MPVPASSTAADLVAAGHLTADEAYIAFSESALRLCRADGGPTAQVEMR